VLYATKLMIGFSAMVQGPSSPPPPLDEQEPSTRTGRAAAATARRRDLREENRDIRAPFGCPTPFAGDLDRGARSPVVRSTERCRFVAPTPASCKAVVWSGACPRSPVVRSSGVRGQM